MHLGVQNPISLDDLSEPQPDLYLARFRADFYAHHHPTPAGLFLVVEIADTSFRYDRQVKIPLYARHAIPEVWLLDLSHGRLLLFREPGPDGYQVTQSLHPGDTLPVPGLPNHPLAIANLLA